MDIQKEILELGNRLRKLDWLRDLYKSHEQIQKSKRFAYGGLVFELPESGTVKVDAKELDFELVKFSVLNSLEKEIQALEKELEEEC